MSKILSFVFSAVLSVLVVWVAASGATTISTNINTGGTLTVTGTSALTGAVTVTGLTTVGYASGTTMSLTGNMLVNGYATTTGADGNIATAGTLTVTGLSTVTGFVSTASSSVSNTLHVSGNLGAGTSTPATEIGVEGSGTTTVRLLSTSAVSASAGQGGCFETEDRYGTAYRMWISSSTGNYAGVATGTASFIAVWEAGHCK